MNVRPHRPHRGDDRGVSVIVGAVLLVSIVLGAVVTIRLTYVPAWEEENEARLMSTVSDQMARLNGEINSRLENATRTPLSQPVTLSQDTGRLFTSGTGAHQMIFTPGTQRQSGIELASPNLLQQVLNGTVLAGGVNETWTTIGGVQTVEDVTSVFNLRLNITDQDPADGDRLIVTITDVDGKDAGRAVAYFETDHPDINLHLKVQTGPSGGSRTTLFDNRILSIHQVNWKTPYYVDLLDPSYRFDRLMEAAATKGAYTLQLLEDPTEARFSITALQTDGSGSTIIGGGGVATTNWARSLSAGTLAYESQNRHFPDQSYVLENGAVILAQDEGAVFKVKPPITVDTVGTTTAVTMSLPVLAGDSTTVTGTDSVIVRTLAHNSQRLVGSMGTLNLTLPTSHPGLWSSFLEQELERAGLAVETATGGTTCTPSATCQAWILADEDADKVELKLYGHTANGGGPANPAYDLSLTLIQATVVVDITS